MRFLVRRSSFAVSAVFCLLIAAFCSIESQAFRVGSQSLVSTTPVSSLAVSVERSAVSPASPSRAAGESNVSSNSGVASSLSALGSVSSSSESALKGPFPVDLRGKIAFVAGVADDHGYGWAICKLLRAAGARVLVGTWPPVHSIFKKGLESGKFTQAVEVSLGENQTAPVDMAIEKVYPLDAAFDRPEDVPAEVSSNKRYAGHSGYTISEVAQAVHRDYGGIDVLVHSLANGPEVTRPLLQTSRNGYLSAVSSSSYSFVSMLQHFLPVLRPAASALALSYIASERVIPGYGGGMSSAKAALESDCRTLAFEAGRTAGVRVNCISAGPLKSRAASAIGKAGDKTFIDLAIDYSKANAPLQRDLESDDVGRAALFLLSPLARAITGTTLYVDNGLHAMGQALDSQALQQGSSPQTQ